MFKLIQALIFITGTFTIFFLAPQKIQAATVSYLITPEILPRPISYNDQRTFFSITLDIPYTSGQVFLSSTPDGTGSTLVDDYFNIFTIRPDGYPLFTLYGYDNYCTRLEARPPIDLSGLFFPRLNNHIQIWLSDSCTGFVSSTPLYLVNINAPDPIPTPTPTPTKTPVIFIPGIGGSEFKSSTTFISNIKDCGISTPPFPYWENNIVWINETMAAASACDDYFDVLKLKTDGITPEYPQVVLKEDTIYQGSYGDTIKFFTSNGYHLGQDLFVFPYDWRTDISLTTPLLANKIEEIKTQTKSQKVDIVAHSMGGLVAKNYINDPTRAQAVRKLITLGTPHLGTPYFTKVLIYGDCLTDPRIKDLLFCIGISSSEIKDVIQNMPGAYELAPSQKYYDFYDGSDNNHPVPFVDNRDVDNNGVSGFLTYPQLKDTLTNLKYNTSLFAPTEAFHNLDNNFNNLNNVDVSIIAGSGQATTGQIIEDYHINFAGIKIPKTDIRKINGDDTVPLFSSSLTDGSKSITGLAKIYYTNQRHSDLVFNGPTMNLVKNILNNDNSLPDKVSITPYHFEGTALSSHSPVLIHAYDQNNNHTGPLPNGDYEINIPGSSYEVLGDAKFIWLPNSGIYTVKFEATDQGSFDFKIRNYENDVNDKTILYKDVPLTNSTKAETIFNTSTPTPPVLNVDADGNRTIDFQVYDTSVLTGEASYDQTPPKTNIKLTGNMGSNNWYKSDVVVELNATEETNGSGILKTEYSLDNGQTIQTYIAPFTISYEGINKLKVKSTDNAGNEESPQETEIKIDKTSPELNISFDIQTRQFKIIGLDNLTPTQINYSSSEIDAADEAGNTTKLQLKSQNAKQDEEQENEDNKEREAKKQEEENKLRIKSISYNTNLPIQQPENEFAVDLENDKKTGNIKKFEQKIEIEKQIEIDSDFNPKKNKTKLEIKQKGFKEQKLEKEGIIFLQLLTNQGVLKIKY